MPLDSRITDIVKKSNRKYAELNAAMEERRDRRNNAIRSYQAEEFDDIEAGDIARDEMDFIQRIEAYFGEDVERFAEIVGTYLAGAPAGDQERIAGNLLRLHEAVAHNVRREVLEGLDSLL